MKVYVVGNGMDYEGNGTEKVFSSRKKALAYISKKYPDYTLIVNERFPNEFEWRCLLSYNAKNKKQLYTDYIYMEIWEVE